MIYNEALKFFENTDELQSNFDWHEFTLEELNLPSVSEILEGVKAIEKKVHLQAWRTKHFTSNTYKGFGLTYNPTFFEKSEKVKNFVFNFLKIFWKKIILNLNKKLKI